MVKVVNEDSPDKFEIFPLIVDKFPDIIKTVRLGGRLTILPVRFKVLGCPTALETLNAVNVSGKRVISPVIVLSPPTEK
jgi:hypothetical protein